MTHPSAMDRPHQSDHMEPSQAETLEFGEDVALGLSQRDKQLSSKYFYDAEGDRLFQAIMQMPEYYLTDAELSILRHQGTQIANQVSDEYGTLSILELGAGDGSKVTFLLDALMQKGAIQYFPIDISQNALDILQANVREALPALDIHPICNEYSDAMASISAIQGRRLVLFLGSNLGNFSDQEAIGFLSQIGKQLHPGDMLLLGVDINQDPHTLLQAYDDADGITKAFNLNLLNRINRELGGDFDLDAFDHDPIYVEDEHAAYSYLTSKTDQSVYISSLDKRFRFNKGEQIHTEVSRKFTREGIEKLAKQCGFSLKGEFLDERQLFADFLLVRDFNSQNESL